MKRELPDGTTLTAPLDEGADDSGDDSPPPGAPVGRFLVIGMLGRGGMGVVLTAYDPLLDRRVALKLLRPGAWSGASQSEGRARLQREAQAMAKLAHPNVVAVHEVGAVGEQLFVAMEHVDGQTLSAWCGAAERDWREVVRMFVAAGRGLEAAHAAGLVHRDFKPDNVLIGADGRPRVGDFGLVSGARAGDDADEDDERVTRHGAVIGTPGYMSPEQARGEASDAQSDQFSFCVALWEALYGERPFAPDANQRHLLAGSVRPPPRKSDVPRWLGEVMLRGLRVDPQQRWPSMSVLLDALGRDPDRRRRRRVASGAALLALGALVAVGARTVQRQRAAVCTGADARLVGVWDGARRQAIASAFSATRLAFADATFAKMAAAIDRYAGAWVAMHEETCRASRGEGRQSEQLLDLRMACLERRRSTLGALTTEWSHGVDAQAIDNAIQAVTTLPSLDECADGSALTGRIPLPKAPAARAQIDGVRAELDRARALGQTKRMQEARKAAEVARVHADATGFVPVRAEAAFLMGALIHSFGEPGATAPLDDAVRLAEQARDDWLAAEAAVELTGAMAEGGLAPAALQIAPVAEALVLRAGDRPALHGALSHWRGTALSNLGRYREAVKVLTEARQVLTGALGAADPLTLDTGAKLMRAFEGFDGGDARVTAKEVLAATRAALGDDHPETGVVLSRLGFYLMQGGDLDGARRMIERAVAIEEAAFGPSSLRTAVAVNELAKLEEATADIAEARRLYQRVLDIRRQLLAPENPLVAHALANLSITTRLMGRLEESHAQITTALAIMQRNFGPVHPDVGYEHFLFADVLAEEGDLDGAHEQYRLAAEGYGVEGDRPLWATCALASFDASVGRCAEARQILNPMLPAVAKDNWLAGATQLALGQCDLQDGAAHASVARLERAVALLQSPKVPPGPHASAMLELSRALVAAGGDAARAESLARQAVAELTPVAPGGCRELTRARRWLRRFRGSSN